MALTLYVDGDRWRSHLRRVLARRPSGRAALVPLDLRRDQLIRAEPMGVAVDERGDHQLGGSRLIDQPAQAFEAIALGLRRVAGLRRRAFCAEFGTDPVARYGDAVEATTRSGLLEIADDALRLTPAGRLLASDVLVAFA